ncbi:MAG: hypothetical protein M3Q46_00790 [Verrucomicrobiota bacterium]|nr:hypothetical protein [Verrucomicrobiota bacterium]
MKKLLLTLCLTSLLLATLASAEDATPTVELKRKSSFDAADARDPFWPIGWKKPGVKSVSSEAAPELSPDSFSLTSVTMGAGPHFAILNGKIIQEGQQFGLQFGQQIYQITLRAIEDGKVILAYQDSEIEVPLRRR